MVVLVALEPAAEGEGGGGVDEEEEGCEEGCEVEVGHHGG